MGSRIKGFGTIGVFFLFAGVLAACHKEEGPPAPSAPGSASEAQASALGTQAPPRPQGSQPPSSTAPVAPPTVAAPSPSDSSSRPVIKNSLWVEYADGTLPQGIVPMQSLSPLVKAVKPGVVNISTTSIVRVRRAQGMDPFQDYWNMTPPESKRQSLGSGFIIHPDGLVMTNNHVVENATEIHVKLNDGREFDAKIVGRDSKTDLALLQLGDGKSPLHNLPTVVLGNSDPLEVGDFVMAVGNPFGLDHSVSLGIVSAKERVIGAGPYDEFIQTDAAINPGNSGGPLFNTRGEVIGVNTAIIAQGQGIGFAVPINVVKGLLPQLSDKGRVVRGWLGVTIQDVTPDLAATLKLDHPRGALVAGVLDEGPADKGGLKSGDVVTSVNGKKVDTFNQLSRYVAYIPPGEKANLTVLRDGKEQALAVTVGERPEEGGDSDQPLQIPRNNDQTMSDKLGMAVQPFVSRLGMRAGGVQIVRILPESPAAKAGVREGDLLVELQRQPIRTMKDYSAAVSQFKTGDMVLMRLQRESASIYVAIRVP